MQKYFEQGVRKMIIRETTAGTAALRRAEAGQRAQTEDVVLPGEHHPEVPLPEIQDTAAHAVHLPLAGRKDERQAGTPDEKGYSWDS